MQVVSIECPNCGAKIERKDNEYFAKCPYCEVEVAFDEIKEEAQIGELKSKVRSLEKTAGEDEEWRSKHRKWRTMRNVGLAAVGVLNFCGFSLVGSSDALGLKFETMLGFGAIFCLLSWILAFVLPFVLGKHYPAYDVLTAEEDKTAGLKAGVKMAFMVLGVLLFSAFAAYIFMRLLGLT